LIDDILEPASLDLDGSIWMFGTPAASAAGFFYDADQLKNSAWEQHAWTLLDNPHLPGAKDWLSRKMQENLWSETDATFRREYRGEWVRDENSLVYQFNKVRNLSDELPDVDWHYALGVDLGFVDSTAFVVIGWSEELPETYVIETSKFTHLTSDDIGRKIRYLDSEYEFERIVADTGGLGKMVVEELSKRFSVNILPAQKRAKHDHIELLNSDFKKGKLQILETEENQLLIDELELLEWDLNERTKGRFIERSDCENHASDAMLYVWRESLAFLHQKEAIQPLLGSDEWFLAEEKRMEEAAEAKIVENITNWWDEPGNDPDFDGVLN